jgi:hypothetical protein
MAAPRQDRIERRLAAILAADVASQLMVAVEVSALAGCLPPTNAGRKRWHFRSGT